MFPLVAISLFLLITTIFPYMEIRKHLDHFKCSISNTLMSERFAIFFDRQLKEYPDFTLTGGKKHEKDMKKGQANAHKAIENLKGLMVELKHDGKDKEYAEQVEAMNTVVKKYEIVTLKGQDLVNLVKQDRRNSARELFLNDIKPSVDGSLMIELDRIIMKNEEELREDTYHLTGLVSRLSIFSSHELQLHLRAMQENVLHAIIAERFSRLLSSQMKEYSDFVLSADREGIQRIANLQNDTIKALDVWRNELVSDENEKEKERETENLKERQLVNEVEKELDSMNRIGLKVVSLMEQARENEAKGLVVNNMEDIIDSILPKVDRIVQEKERHLDESLSHISGGIQRTASGIGILSVVVLFVGIGSPWVLSRRFINPIVKLRKAAARIGEGKLETQTDISSEDELGELAAAFNSMAVSLADTTVSKEYMDNIIHSMMDSLIVISPEGDIISVNDATNIMLGYGEGELAGQPMGKILVNGKLPLKGTAIDVLLEKGESFVVEKEYLSKGGKNIPVFFSMSVMRNSTGKLEGFVCVAQDITERKWAEEALSQARRKIESRANELEQRNREMSLLREMGEKLQTSNSVKEAYAIIAKSVGKLFPEGAGALYLIKSSRDLVEAAVSWGAPLHSENIFAPDKCWALRSGRTYLSGASDSEQLCQHLEDPNPASHLCVPMMAMGEAMGILHLQFATGTSDQPEEARDYMMEPRKQLAVTVAEHIALALANLNLRETLRMQSIRDPLTGLFNRRYMEESMERELSRAERKKRQVGIIMIDIDHFKRFNDIFGHEAGDAVLRELGAFVRGNIREEDIACRYGGEEFALILPEATLDITLHRAEQLCEGVRKIDIQHLGKSLGSITLSLGVAMFPDHGLKAETVLRAADSALYRAKAEGRDRVVLAETLQTAPQL